MIAAMMLLATKPASSCDLAMINNASDVYEALSQRAIKIVAAASTKGAKADAFLDSFVDKSASFDIIIGDVGLPATGIAGARTFANTIKSNEYRLLGWDYMDRPGDACEKQAVTVEFVNSRAQRISHIEFTFQQARLIAAKGWQRSFKSGPLVFPTSGGNGS